MRERIEGNGFVSKSTRLSSATLPLSIRETNGVFRMLMRRAQFGCKSEAKPFNARELHPEEAACWGVGLATDRFWRGVMCWRLNSRNCIYTGVDRLVLGRKVRHRYKKNASSFPERAEDERGIETSTP